MSDIQFHPIANIWPMLSDVELHGLADDIAANGLLYPIWRHRDGRIIDGRNRWLACERAGVECPSNTYAGADGADLVAFVVSLNEKRRHLSESQRAMVAAKIEQIGHGGDRQDANLHLGRSRAAEMLQVSPRSVAAAKSVQRIGSPELVEAVEQGRIAVSTAATIAKAPKAEQPGIVARGREQILKEASRIKREEKERKRTDRENKSVAIQAALPAASDRWRLINGNVDDLAEIEDGSIDCIITDPPYPREFLPVYADLGRTAARVLKPGGSCFVMIGQSYMPDIIQSLGESLTYHWCLSYLTPGGQAVQIFPRKVNAFWKPVLWFTKGVYTGEWLGDVAQGRPNDNDKRFHHWGQSESGMADLVRRCSGPGETILDPFCGAGTTGVVAVSLGRYFIGADLDSACVDRSAARLSQEAQDAA